MIFFREEFKRSIWDSKQVDLHLTKCIFNGVDTSQVTP